MSEATGHSETDNLPDGTSNNQAESYNWRMRRAAEGIYPSPSNKYLADYAVEAAWREHARHLLTGQKLRALLRVAMGVGLSRWWRGYRQGRHRTFEMLVEGLQEARGRGKRKGAKPKVPY